MRPARAAAFVVLILAPNAFAAGNDAALSAKLRAVTQQYDSIADRSLSPSSVDLSQVREQFGNSLRAAASTGEQLQQFRELAEIFVLSGGDSAMLEPWGEGLEPNSAEKKLFDGVMAYGTGKTAEAEAKLLALDASSFNPLRGGHLSLAQALLSARLDPKRAFGYFQNAALLLPGTLVEEAALRQSAVLAAKTSDAGKFSPAAISYLRRFRRSAYVAGFETQVTFYIARFPSPDGVRILHDILAAVPEGWGRCLACFLTNVAEQAVLMGKVELTGAATAAALPLLSGDSPERQQLLLYSGSAAIVTDKYLQGLETLHTVRESKLLPEERELLHASLVLALKLRETPMLLSSLKLDASAKPSKGNRDFPQSGRVEAAKQALANADAILKNAK